MELTGDRPFARTLETLTRKRLAQRATLERLQETDVGAMLAALGGPSPPQPLIDTVYRETQGNPFFVEEVFQHLSEERTLRMVAGALTLTSTTCGFQRGSDWSSGGASSASATRRGAC